MAGTGGPVGNTKALAHGASSPRTIAPIAAQYEAELIQAAPWTAQTAFAPTRAALARCEARIQLLSAWLDERGGAWGLNARQQLRPATSLLMALEAQADRLRARLGLDPVSRARLGRHVAGTAFDMARAMQEITEEEDH
jgi:hypothetical protein